MDMYRKLKILLMASLVFVVEKHAQTALNVDTPEGLGAPNGVLYFSKIFPSFFSLPESFGRGPPEAGTECMKDKIKRVHIPRESRKHS